MNENSRVSISVTLEEKSDFMIADTVSDMMLIKEYSPEDILQFRQKNKLSRREFAEILGLSTKAIEAWEAGINKPSGSSQRLLQIIESKEEIFVELKQANEKREKE